MRWGLEIEDLDEVGDITRGKGCGQFLICVGLSNGISKDVILKNDIQNYIES